MNFGSAFTLHDSDGEEEEVREDTHAGPLFSMAPMPSWLAGGPSDVAAASSFTTNLLPSHTRTQIGEHHHRPPPPPPSHQGDRNAAESCLETPTAPEAGPAGEEISGLTIGCRTEEGTFGLGNARNNISSVLPIPKPVPPRVEEGGGLWASVRSPNAELLPEFTRARPGSRPEPKALRTQPAVDALTPSYRAEPEALGASIFGGGRGGGKKAAGIPGVQSQQGSRSRSSILVPRRGKEKHQSRTWTRKVDTNILNIDMAALGNAAPFATGDPTICSGCRACLSDVSILNPARTDNASDTTQTVATADAAGVIEDVYDWKCEYCGEVNRVELDDMEKPVKGQDSVEYVIEPAPLATTSAGGKGDHDGKDESAVLFVIDTSGSMCVTTAVEGRLSLRGDRTKDLARLLAVGDSRNQVMPGQRRGVTYVSRLQSMQAAIDTQLETIGKVTPSRHVGLVTFNGEVCLIGDGSSDSRVVAGDRLSDKEALREVGRAYPLSRPISEARERLSERLFALEEGGPTALGPAVVAGLSMLKERGGRGSRLVLCTDGLANVGVGALDDLKTDEEREAAEKLYAEVGLESSENGVTIEVVSVDSDACDLENLGAMADMSGGTVTRVKASELATNFAGILANPILASQVSVRVTLHKGLMFRNVDLASDVNTLDRDVGNVTRETELNFEYEVRTRAQRRAMGIPDNGFVSSPSVRPLPFPAPEIPTAEATVTTAAAPGAGPTASKEVNLQSEKTKCGGAKLNIKQESGKHATTAEKKGSNDEKAPTAPAAAEVSATPAQAFLPFQVQIRYTRPDGMKCMRVLTKTQRVTKSKVEAEKSMSMAVVAGHAASQAGNMASKGAYQSTRVSMRAWTNLMERNSESAKAKEQVAHFGSQMAVLDSEIATAQTSEFSLSEDRDAKGGTVDDVKESAALGRNRKSARSGNDSLSLHAYGAKSHSSKRYH